MKLSRSILLLALASFAPAAPAGEPEDAVPEVTVFFQQAAQTGLAEIEAAKMALARSQHPGIRAFAQRMIEDHGRINIELAALAAAMGIDTPSQLDAEHQGMLDELATKSGSDFDLGYSEHMRMGHTRAVALFEAAGNSPDARVASFAKKTLPALREHKQLAAKLPGANEGALPGGR